MKTERNEGVAARIWTLDNGDRVVAEKIAVGQWQPTYEHHDPGDDIRWEAPRQSSAVWTIAGLKALCAKPADEVRRALVGDAS